MDPNVIANLLVSATQRGLLKRVETWLERNHPNAKLKVRVGRGQATQVSFTEGEDDYTLTYGVKMIQSKFTSYAQCSAWTTGKEILKRGYFNGKLTVKHALVHTVIHEFGHFIQILGGYVQAGSIHNDKFYEILDRMHKSGAAMEVLDFLNSYDEFKELVFEDGSTEMLFHQGNVAVGDRVVFLAKGDIRTCIKVDRVNKSTVSQQTDTTKSKVPYGLILEVL